MMKKTILTACLFIIFSQCFSQSQRALIIGIDEYAPPPGIKPSNYRLDWPTLNGCKNDAQSIKAIITQSFGFAENNIKEIYNKEATRNAILKAMDELFNQSGPGDIAFIYYAGHGSQVRNSLSTETDLKDESMVPVDTWKEGVADIRDKELAKICNRFIDKGVKLTLVFDCCHSGSIARGLYQPKYRYISESNVDAKDNSNPTPPDSRIKSNYIILSAAQDNEGAAEQEDNGVQHGAFTVAFMKALSQQSSRASVQNIFNSTRAILKSNGKSQEPVLAGDTARFGETLFGLNKSQIPAKTLIPFIDFDSGKLILQAGFASGINVGNELARFKGKDTVRIRVTKILGINQSEAEVIKGNANKVMPGELFEVTNWVSSNTALLKIFIPGGNYSYADLAKLATINAALKKQNGENWINSFDKAAPDLTIKIANNEFILTEYAKGINGSTKLKDFNAGEINGIIKGRKLFVNLPAPHALVAALQSRFEEYKTIQFVKDPSAAQYILYGTIDDNDRIEYGLVKSDISLNDSLSSMPTYTAPGVLNDSTEGSYKNVADGIFENALKLSKIRGWINITAPIESDFFPYHLVMWNKNGKKPVDPSGVKVGDVLYMDIEADDDYLDETIKTKYLYLFIIDSKGKMQLLYPAGSQGNNDNKFPFQGDDGRPANKFKMADNLTASEPVGTDNYFLLASEEQITGYSEIFNQEGVRGIGPGNANPLSKLLDMGNESSARGVGSSTPSNWVLKRLFIVTKH